MTLHAPVETRTETTGRSLAPIRVLGLVAGFGFVIFQLLFAVFYVFYRIADEWAVDRSEASGGFDPGQLLPHDGVLWLAATGSALLLVLIDIVLIVMAVLWFRARTREARGDS